MSSLLSRSPPPVLPKAPRRHESRTCCMTRSYCHCYYWYLRAQAVNETHGVKDGRRKSDVMEKGPAPQRIDTKGCSGNCCLLPTRTETMESTAPLILKASSSPVLEGGDTAPEHDSTGHCRPISSASHCPETHLRQLHVKNQLYLPECQIQR